MTTYHPDIEMVFSDGSATGSLEKLKNSEIDILLRYLMLDTIRTKYFSFLESVFEDSIAIVVPPASELSPFVKLLYPFTMITWFSLLIFVVGICFLILNAKKSSKLTYDFVIGSNISYPYTSFIVVVIGSSQKVLPKGPFARKTNVRSDEITTTDGFYENGFQFYTYNPTAQMFKGSKYLIT